MQSSERRYVLERPLEETVLYEKVERRIARVTLNRPEKHNALYPPDQFNELARKVNMAVEDPEVKVIVLRGNGPSFCSGDDLNLAPYDTYGGAPGQKPPQRLRVQAVLGWLNGLYRTLLYCPKPIIAQCHGWTIGVGLALVMCCDLAIAAESARFSQRQQRVGFSGLSMGWQMIQLLTLGYKRMREWQLTGRTIDARTAREWGVVNVVVPDQQLEEETMRWARAVALNPADGLVIAKTHTLLMLDLLGVPGQFEAGALGYALFTNLKWDDEEYNFLKMRNQLGLREAFAQRDRLWAELGFE
ncbi:MAG: enoyl-CoA hydratase/isomerase family protein [Chloroflexota bacterium]|jgi:enoyl-CoA hydratase/carnithine racemase|nr:enoyl-CoA hydratase/isomerase family protein [Chloroflexota bacterium]MDW8008924.1 enoyl-CoA hydratase/isomerase family protein [Chloroflexota bacterium]